MPQATLKTFLKKAIMTCLTLSTCCLPFLSHGSSLQRFGGNNFYNPAEFFYKTNKAHVFIGGMQYFPELRFSGTQTTSSNGGPYSGVARSNVEATSPNIEIFTRINSRAIIGLVINEPWLSPVNWGDSILRYASMTTLFRTIDISPNIVFLLTKGWVIGGGLDFVYGRGTLTSAVDLSGNQPIVLPNANGLVLTNKGTDWAFGYHIGSVFHVAKGSFIGLTYYSKQTLNLRGSSTLIGANPATYPTTGGTTVIPLPSTTLLTFTQFFSEKFLVRAEVDYTTHSRFKTLTLLNTALVSPFPQFKPLTGQSIIPFFYKNTWRYALGTRYQINPTYAVLAGLSLDQSPSNMRYRTVALPNSTQIAAKIGAVIKMNKMLKLHLAYIYSHFLNGAPINVFSAGSNVFTSGRVELNASVITAGLEVSV